MYIELPDLFERINPDMQIVDNKIEINEDSLEGKMIDTFNKRITVIHNAIMLEYRKHYLEMVRKMMLNEEYTSEIIKLDTLLNKEYEVLGKIRQI